MHSKAEKLLIKQWRLHKHIEFVTKNIDDLLDTMTDHPKLVNVPTMLVAEGKEQVRTFYSHSFVNKIPEDTVVTPVSLTLGKNSLVDEQILKCTHSIQMDWMLPNIPPTGKEIKVPIVVIVGFQNGKISSEHVYWDQATVLAQVGLIDAKGLPIYPDCARTLTQ